MLVDELAPHSSLIQAGASLVDLGSNLVECELPAIDPSKTAAWGTSNNVDPSTLLVKVAPKRLTAKIVVSKQLLLVNPAISLPLIERQLFSAIASQLEQAALSGSGTTQPLGILNDSTISRIAAAPSLANIAQAEAKVSSAYLENNITVLASPACRQRLRATATVTEPVWRPNLAQVCSAHLSGDAAIVGSFADLVLATWGPINLLIDPYSRDTEGFVSVRAELWMDSVVLRPGSIIKVYA